ncbi:hypothetical protein OFC18_29955, partial [Escherichia coli]|nr:hypothetical protein [Escherichia coli]
VEAFAGCPGGCMYLFFVADERNFCNSVADDSCGCRNGSRVFALGENYMLRDRSCPTAYLFENHIEDYAESKPDFRTAKRF